MENTNKRGYKSLLILFFALIILIIMYPAKKEFKYVTRSQIDIWKQHYFETSFEGKVVKIETSLDNDKILKSIYMKLIDTSNFKNIDTSFYLFSKDNMIHLSATNLNVNASPSQKINIGDLIKKNKFSDTIYVLDAYYKNKYFFPLFDGMGTKGTQMKIK